MIHSIITKEWLKLRFYLLAIFLIALSTLGYFWFNLNFAFSTIEPESMMWYKFSHLEDKPYFYLSYLFLIIGVAISFAQFIPERINKRIKIMAHLPLNLKNALFLHLLIGISFIAILSLILAIGLIAIMNHFYPDIITLIVLKDTFFYTLASVILYIGLSAVIIEIKHTVAFLKFILVTLFVVIFLKIEYETLDLVWILFLLFIPFLALDSFYSIKQQRLESLFFKGSLGLVVISFIYLSYLNYTQNYKHTFNKYYIFYSNVINDFVYQKNFGDHQFEYGIKDQKTFNQYEYESYLPFVYWRNLDIQKKLPVTIGDVQYDKKLIKSSRLGFSYNPSMLKDLEVKLFPLLNPQSNKGMIVFPQEAFTITTLGAMVYAYDNIKHTNHKHQMINKRVVSLEQEINKELVNSGFRYPVKNIWGKPTNMKPYDKGYLILDNKDQLFNLYMSNNIVYVKKHEYPKGIELAFVKLSENKQKLLSGYAIDKNSNFYLLTWDFRFIKLDLPNFDYKTMKLKLISNPINYLIRYDNGSSYHGVVFDKNYKRIKNVEFNNNDYQN
jgi:hypothetical protein